MEALQLTSTREKVMHFMKANLTLILILQVVFAHHACLPLTRPHGVSLKSIHNEPAKEKRMLRHGQSGFDFVFSHSYQPSKTGGNPSEILVTCNTSRLLLHSLCFTRFDAAALPAYLDRAILERRADGNYSWHPKADPPRNIQVHGFLLSSRFICSIPGYFFYKTHSSWNIRRQVLVTMPDTEASTLSTAFETGSTYSLHGPGGDALSVVPGKYLSEEVHIGSWEHARNQLWQAAANNDGFGFRNASTGKLLGVNKNGDIACHASNLDDWERFKFEGSGSDILFYVIFKGNQQYIFRPAQWNSLQRAQIERPVCCNEETIRWTNIVWSSSMMLMFGVFFGRMKWQCPSCALEYARNVISHLGIGSSSGSEDSWLLDLIYDQQKSYSVPF